MRPVLTVRTFLTVSRAREARRADVARRSWESAARLPRRLRARRSSRPATRSALDRGTVTRRAPCAALRPCRATAASAHTLSPLPTVRAERRDEPALPHVLQGGGHPPGDSSLEPKQDHPQERSLRSRLRRRYAPLLTVIFFGSIGAYRKDGQAWTLAAIQSTRKEILDLGTTWGPHALPPAAQTARRHTKRSPGLTGPTSGNA